MSEEEAAASLSYGGEIWRKALHLVSLIIPIGLLLWGKATALLILVPVATLFVLSEIARSRSTAVRSLIYRLFGFMMRPEEIPDGPAPLRFNGATWVLLSACVVVAVFEPDQAAAGFIIGLIGDAAAALVGRKFGRRRYGHKGKTIEGTVAFVVAAWLAVQFVPGVPPLGSLAAVAVAALVEGIGLPINDNLSVPFAAALVLTLV